MATSNLPEPPTAALSQTPYSVDLSLENLALRLRDLHVSSSGREENEENSGSDQRMISSGGNNNGVSFNGGDVSYQIMVNSMDSVAVKRKIAELALDPYGSMLLKQKLMKNDKQITDVVFNAVFRYMFEVMVHPCGAHVFGKLLECCDQSQLQLVVTKISLQSQTFLESLFNMPGTNCAKRLIEALENSPLISEIISILVFAFVPVMTDQVASSVVMKCFDILNVRQNQKLYEELVKNCLKLATDEHGCIALKNSITYIRGPYRTQLLETISSHAVFLSQDPYGNYVIQRVLKLQDPGLTDIICFALKGNYVYLSRQKYSSHVLQKCLLTSGMNYALEEFADFDKLWQIARDPYGNYVLKTALQVAESTDSPFYEKLLKKLDQDKEKFRSGYGRNVYFKVLNSRI